MYSFSLRLFSSALSGPVARQDVALELTHLQETELKLDKLIQNCTLQIYQMFENQHAQRYPSSASSVSVSR